MSRRSELEEEIYQKHRLLVQASRGSLFRFTMSTMPTFRPVLFHRRYYDALTQFAFGAIKKLAVFIPPQCGKLLPSDTPVLTTKGWKNHGDLQVGDEVFGQDGLPKKVLWNSGVYDWEVKELSFQCGYSIECAREHLWKLMVEYDDHKGRREKIMEAGAIFSKRHRRSPYVECNSAIQMPQRNLPIDPYILGLWLGDGLNRQGVIVAGDEDSEYMSQFGEARQVRKGYWRILVAGLSKSLRENNLICNKHIPVEYLLSSVEQRTALLCGLMDTDGTVDKKGNCEFSQKKGQLAEDVFVLLRSLGYKPRKKESDMKLNGRVVGKKIRIFFNPNREDEVFRLERKAKRIGEKERADRSDKYKFFVKSFGGEAKTVKGNCIEVEGGMYLAGRALIPTHNSEGSTRRLPAFLLGLNPNCRIAIISYNSPKARKFNREIQRIIDTPEYNEIFPNTQINSKNVTKAIGSWLRNADECEIVGYRGGFKTVGVGGPLTGDPVDVLIMDDIYKDAASAWSPTVRANIQDWYDTVAETRLHNDSQQLIVFTRWHEDDLGGSLLRQQGIYDPETNPDGWVVITYPAIKEGEPTEYDPRQPGEALWPERHSLHKLELIRQRNPHVFQSLYQQKPTPKEGLMYHDFNTYKELPEEGVDKCCSDPADTGSDFLCSIFYREYHGCCFVTDVYYTQDDMDVTEPEMARRLARNGTKECIIEANNAGRLYAKNIERRCREQGNTFTRFDTFWQTENKAVRIYSNSNAVNNIVVMPEGWEKKWPQYHAAMMGFLKVGVNPNDDAPDCTTLLVEHMNQTNKDISGFFF